MVRTAQVGARPGALIEAQPGSSRRPRVSVIVLAYNEEANLPACLASLEHLDCEVLVVDSGSTDATCSIARQVGAAVFEHPFETYGAQRNWAQQHLPLAADWVLHLDSDERLTPELVAEINGILLNPPADVDGFLFRKRTLFMGRWIRHGGHYPAYHLRLFRKDRGACEERLYDQHYVVSGRVQKLQHDYIDVLTSDLSVWSTRHVRWAELEAREIVEGCDPEGRVEASFLGNPIERRRWLREGFYWRLPLFLRAFLYWFYRYFVRLGFLDGKEGMIFHFLQGFWFRFLIDAKLYESRKQRSAAAPNE
ncbi:MAG: glycosyltransferase family 2 protein [Terriglobales bacterium]